MLHVLTFLLAVGLLAACTGGGGSGSPVASAPDTPRVQFAASNNGHYDTIQLPPVAATDVRHMPAWRDNLRLGVGVGQGNQHIGVLPNVGRRGAIDIKHGSIDDGVGSATLREFLRHTNAGHTPHGVPIPPVTVSWDSSASEADRRRIIRAVQMVNAALPESHKMTIAGRGGSIPIRFINQSDYEREYGDGWGISLYSGGIEINRQYSVGGDRQAIILLSHELIHKLDFGHPPHSDYYDTIMESGRNARGYGTIYDEHQGIPQPLSILYPVDREALRNLYGPTQLGPWSSSSLHIAGHGHYSAFGVALRNGYAEPWAYGAIPDTDLAGNLSGSATWTGALVGLTPGASAVAGDARIGVSLGTMTGRADFTNLEAWAASAAPGAAGTGMQWLNGNLGYTIAVRGNAFRETGGDDGRLTGIFVGAQHQGTAGTLERSDLTAAFGASRQ